MNFDKKNKVGSSKESTFSKIEKIHPFEMMLYLAIMGVGVLFLMLVIAYLQTRSYDNGFSQIRMPKYFSLSTILILISSYTISKAPRQYKKDSLAKLKKTLLYTMLLGISFILVQLASWYEISQSGISFSGLAAGTYIYLISALHAVHLIAGFFYLSYLYFKTQHAASDPIRMLLYIRNPYVRQQIKLLNIYWHFMDAMWVFLFLVFVFTLKA
ncbi:cytochrome oxidase subunit III [Adhaeribacter aerolatus]|uniref:Cytochrome oxidase subunit III n=1 Tax=Adhaeribacter aerolatus TaxID=670289 RepID=A0A512AYF2_9BACT|nr:cytochrome c oxidase subunit 3 [Adhaeribacter aerolatus]GEO04739.1 cytochrome oxidase subunit III [Adhaeribacter aerolatus]